MMKFLRKEMLWGRDGYSISDTHSDARIFFGTRSEAIKAYCERNRLKASDYEWYLWNPKLNDYVLIRKKKEKTCKTQK